MDLTRVSFCVCEYRKMGFRGRAIQSGEYASLHLLRGQILRERLLGYMVVRRLCFWRSCGGVIVQSVRSHMSDLACWPTSPWRACFGSLPPCAEFSLLLPSVKSLFYSWDVPSLSRRTLCSGARFIEDHISRSLFMAAQLTTHPPHSRTMRQFLGTFSDDLLHRPARQQQGHLQSCSANLEHRRHSR